MQNRFEVFTLLISRLNKVIKRIKTKEVEEYGLKSSHVTIMYVMHKYNGVTLKQLCDYCEEDKAIISRSVEYLKQKELVAVLQDSSKYKLPFVLTNKGQEVAKGISLKIDAYVERASLGLNEEDRNVMYASLNKICENLEKITD